MGLVAVALALAAGYQISLPERVDAVQGERTVVSLTLSPDPGGEISRTGPLVVQLAAEPEAAFELPKRRYQRADAADAKADAPRFELVARALQPGNHTLHVSVRFWLCRRHTCRPV